MINQYFSALIELKLYYRVKYVKYLVHLNLRFFVAQKYIKYIK